MGIDQMGMGGNGNVNSHSRTSLHKTFLLPDVGLGRKNAVEKRFWRHPLDRKHRSTALTIVIRAKHHNQPMARIHCG